MNRITYQEFFNDVKYIVENGGGLEKIADLIPHVRLENDTLREICEKLDILIGRGLISSNCPKGEYPGLAYQSFGEREKSEENRNE